MLIIRQFLSRNKYIFLILITLGVIADRTYWSCIALWREDEATNLWLGYTQGIHAIPVGLISSPLIPNPNGMVLFGKILSGLPGLLPVSAVLGSLQALLVILLGWLMFETRPPFWIVIGPLLTSVILRSTSVDLWNQWVITLVNLLFFNCLVFYIRRPCIWKAPLLLIPILLAPALYLAGIVNMVAFGLLTILVFFLKPPALTPKNWILPVTVSLILFSVVYFITWRPYFHQIGLEQILSNPAINQMTIGERIGNSLISVIAFPYWILLQWYYFPHNLAFPQSDIGILSTLAIGGIQIIRHIHLVQAALSLIVFFPLLVLKFFRKYHNRWANEGYEVGAVTVLFAILFLVISYALSPIFGGPIWALNQRLDQLEQYLPFFLLVWFGSPLVFRFLPNLQRITTLITISLAVIYSIVSMTTGWNIIRSYLDYRGATLTYADVPLLSKLQAIDFIASDWKSNSDSKWVPVNYDLAGLWEWVPTFGTRLEKWYPSPMTTGREYDYELLRRYGLHNVQEGIQLRTLGLNDENAPAPFYLVSYAFRPAPQKTGFYTENYIFGRVRVTKFSPLK